MAPNKPRFMHESAYRALMAKHRCYAANALVSGDLSRIDPNIGTALCQVYSLIVVNLCHEVQCALRADGILEHAISQVASFQRTVAQADVTITQVRLPEDVWNNGEPDDGYLCLVERVSAITGLCGHLLVTYRHGRAEPGRDRHRVHPASDAGVLCQHAAG